MSVVRGRPPGLAGGMSGSIKRYWSSLRAWPDPKSPTQVRSAGVHIVASRQGKVPGAPSARHSSPVKLTSTPFQNGLLGAIGSIVFWLVLRWTGALQTIALNPPAPIASRNRPAVLILTTAIITSVAVMAIPSITKDRTCHNLFRDGRTFASPKVNIDLDIDLEDWPRFTTLLQQF